MEVKHWLEMLADQDKRDGDGFAKRAIPIGDLQLPRRVAE